jgi:hypothetical protein
VRPTYLFGRLVFSGVVVDASAIEQVLRKSRLDWARRITASPGIGSNTTRVILDDGQASLIRMVRIKSFVIIAVLSQPNLPWTISLASAGGFLYTCEHRCVIGSVKWPEMRV